MDWWTLFNRARAVENTVYVVAVNQGASLAHYPPFSWPGGSMVVAPIDLDTLRAERQRRHGHDMRAHLRSELYDYLRHPWFPAASPDEHPLDAEGIRERIHRAKRQT